jgi:Deoxyribonuclease NucA/NucB
MFKKSVIMAFLAGLLLTLSALIVQAQTPPTVTFSRARVPNIAAHISQAQASGKPSTLTYLGPNSPTQTTNRQAACGSFKASAADTAAGRTSCDEYPFASTSEGGAGASTAAVPVSEQNSQGGTLSSFYTANGLTAGSKFRVAVGP